MNRRRLILIAGSGSTAEFLARAFGPAAAYYGLILHLYAVRSTDPLEDGFEFFDALQPGPRDVVGGVSVGAHLGARWLATRHAGNRAAPGLLAAMPAWTGAPGPVAAVTADSANQLRSADIQQVIGRLRAEARRTGATAQQWVVDELAAAWPTYGEQLADVLEACGRSAGPSAADLRAVVGRSVVLALTDDPMHPLSTARTWVACLGQASLRTMAGAQMGADRASLGWTALAALP